MSLKRDIIVKNEYTLRLPDGSGTRGSTPGNYAVQYMARPDAVETLAPIRRDRVDNYVTRYAARDSAVDRAITPSDVRTEIADHLKYGGVAFGYGQVSLSNQEVKEAGEDIQRLFDDGKTVLKTVLSFDQEYLRRHGIIDEEFQVKERGDYYGNIDQLKLRMGIMDGLRRLSHDYDDLRYVGVIQVDTKNVHCHLAMVDAGEGLIAEDGTQKGKLSERQMMLIRRGVDASLDEMQQIKHMSSAVHYERRNVTTYVKRWTHDQMRKESLPQFLLACLPEDKNMWRAGSNRQEMRKPNEILKEIVTDVLEQDDSGMSLAMTKVYDYANTRRENEKLTTKQWGKLVDQGRDRIVEGCMNGVYGMLKVIPEDIQEIKTPMLSTMSLDMEELTHQYKSVLDSGKDSDTVVEFGYRLRSYSSRLRHHRDKREDYHARAREWEQANSIGAADAASRPLYDFYQEEEDYHARCAAKYQHFLPMTRVSEEWYEEWDELAQYGDRIIALEMMSKDQSLRQLKDSTEAEERGREIYDQPGGALLTKGSAGRDIIDARIEAMRSTYDRRLDDLAVKLHGEGLDITADRSDVLSHKSDASSRDEAQKPQAVIEPTTEFEFKDVKALDLHHLRFDFASDVELSESSKTAFIQRARRRVELFDAASAYLEVTGQSDQIATLDGDDIEAGSAMAEELNVRHDGRYPSSLALLQRQQAQQRTARRARTVALSERLSESIVHEVEDAAEHIELGLDQGRDALE